MKRTRSITKKLEKFITEHKIREKRGVDDAKSAMNMNDIVKHINSFQKNTRPMFNKNSEKESRSKYVYVVSLFDNEGEEVGLYNHIFSTFAEASRFFLKSVTGYRSDKRITPYRRFLISQVEKVYQDLDIKPCFCII